MADLITIAFFFPPTSRRICHAKGDSLNPDQHSVPLPAHLVSRSSWPTPSLYIWTTRRTGSDEVQQFTTLCARAGSPLSKCWPVKLPVLVATIVPHPHHQLLSGPALTSWQTTSPSWSTTRPQQTPALSPQVMISRELVPTPCGHLVSWH
jgi:hypothetical protein